MNKKTLPEIFQSFFHSKYSFDDFKRTTLKVSNNIFEKEINKHNFFSYKNDKKEFTLDSKKLYDFHRFSNEVLFQNLFFNDCVYSYRKSYSIYDVAFRHKDSKYYFKTDIKNFFSSIDKNCIKNCLENNLKNFPKDTSKYLLNILEMIIYNDSLPIGIVTSPSISNAILYDFDNFMEEHSKNNNIIYTRYSDDLIFSSNDRNSLNDIDKLIAAKLDTFYNQKFVLNNNKTKYFDKTKKVKLLGIIITPDNHITVDKYKKESIKQLLYFYKNDKAKFEIFLNERYNGKLSKAYGILNYISDIDKSFIIYLRKKYGNFVIDKFLHGTK